LYKKKRTQQIYISLYM